MRHINKSEPCQDFDNYVKEMYLDISLDNYIKHTSVKKHPWKRLNNEIKEILAKHLYTEQKGLCIYCQQSLANAFPNLLLSKAAHIEHLKPKTRDKYPQQTFNQKNLTLSCNGFDCKKEKGTSEFCGHNKLEEYNSCIAYSSAACGADIIFLEEILDMGGEINIILPFEVESFL